MNKAEICFCGHSIPWRRYMKYGIKQICPYCGAWRWLDESGLHVTKVVTARDECIAYHSIAPNCFHGPKVKAVRIG